MYLTLYLFVPDPVLDLVPGRRYKVLRSTLYRGAGTRYSKVPCTYQQVQGRGSTLYLRYKVLYLTQLCFRYLDFFESCNFSCNYTPLGPRMIPKVGQAHES